MPLKERYAPHDLPCIAQSLLRCSLHPRPAAPRRILPRAKERILSEVHRVAAIIVNIRTKLTKGGRTIKEETEASTAPISVSVPIYLSLPPPMDHSGSDEESLTLECERVAAGSICIPPRRRK